MIQKLLRIGSTLVFSGAISLAAMHAYAGPGNQGNGNKDKNNGGQGQGNKDKDKGGQGQGQGNKDKGGGGQADKGGGKDKDKGGKGNGGGKDKGGPGPGASAGVPEIDPAAAGSLATLLLGGTALLTAKRRKRNS